MPEKVLPIIKNNTVADAILRDTRISQTWDDPHRGQCVADLLQELRSTEGVAGVEYIGSGELWFRFDPAHCTEPQKSVLQVRLYEIFRNHLDNPDKYWVTH